MASSSRFRLLVALITVYLIWGSTYLAIKFTIETLPPFLMAGVRFLIAGLLLTGFAVLRGASRPTAAHWKTAFVVGTLLLLGGNGAVVWGQQFVASGLAALLIATEPLWVVLIDWVRPQGRRPYTKELAGLVLGFAGALLLIAPADLVGGAQSINPFGAGMIIFASISWAAGSVISRQAESHPRPIMSTGMNMLAGGTALMVVSILTGDAWRLDIGAASAKSWLALLYLIVFGAILGFSAYLWLLRNTTLALASTYAYVNPAVAILLGWAFASETISPRVLTATAIIVVGVVLITTAGPGRPREPEPEHV